MQLGKGCSALISSWLYIDQWFAVVCSCTHLSICPGFSIEAQTVYLGKFFYSLFKIFLEIGVSKMYLEKVPFLKRSFYILIKLIFCFAAKANVGGMTQWYSLNVITLAPTMFRKVISEGNKSLSIYCSIHITDPVKQLRVTYAYCVTRWGNQFKFVLLFHKSWSRCWKNICK